MRFDNRSLESRFRWVKRNKSCIFIKSDFWLIFSFSMKFNNFGDKCFFLNSKPENCRFSFKNCGKVVLYVKYAADISEWFINMLHSYCRLKILTTVYTQNRCVFKQLRIYNKVCYKYISTKTINNTEKRQEEDVFFLNYAPMQKRPINYFSLRSHCLWPWYKMNYVLIRPAQTNIKYLSTKLNTLVGWAACHTEQHLAFIQCKYNVQERDLLCL